MNETGDLRYKPLYVYLSIQTKEIELIESISFVTSKNLRLAFNIVGDLIKYSNKRRKLFKEQLILISEKLYLKSIDNLYAAESYVEKILILSKELGKKKIYNKYLLIDTNIHI